MLANSLVKGAHGFFMPIGNCLCLKLLAVGYNIPWSKYLAEYDIIFSNNLHCFTLPPCLD